MIAAAVALAFGAYYLAVLKKRGWFPKDPEA